MRDFFITLFGTFGNPNGYAEHIFFNDHNIKLLNLFDLPQMFFKITQKDLLYSIRKERVNNNLCISLSKHIYAKEPKSQREGTFVGTGITFVNKYPNESIAIPLIDKILNAIVSNSKNIENSTLKVDHARNFDRSKLKEIQDIEQIVYNISEIDERITTKNDKVAIVLLDSLDFLNINMNNYKLLLVKYGTIYYTDSKTLFEFTKNKAGRIYDTFTEDNVKSELNNIIVKLDELKINKEKERLADLERKRKEEDEKLKLEKEKKWEQNQISKNDLNQNKRHDDIVSQIKHLQDKVKSLKSEKYTLENRIQESSNYTQNQYRRKENKEEKGFNIKYIILSSIPILLVSLIGTFFYFNNKVSDLKETISQFENEKIEKEEIIEQQKEEERKSRENEENKRKDIEDKKRTLEAEKIKKEALAKERKVKEFKKNDNIKKVEKSLQKKESSTEKKVSKSPEQEKKEKTENKKDSKKQ